MEETNEVVELTYIPRYVKQVADYLHGDTLDHEAFNQLLNVNSTQGDYNTEVLNTLFNGEDAVYKIKYVDNKFTELDETISEITGDVGDIKDVLEEMGDAFDTIDKTFAAIEDGTQTVGHAQVADNLFGLIESGPNRYYGTDANSNTGFFPVPEVIYCEDISSAVDFSGITITPAPNSVTEAMLTSDVQTKLNRQAGVTDYEYLTSKPKINNVELTGNVSIEDLGIQEAGDFVTNTSLTNTLSDYVTTTDLDTTLNDYVTTEDVNDQIDDVNDSIDDVSAVANSAAVVKVGTFIGTPKTGDLLITF